MKLSEQCIEAIEKANIYWGDFRQVYQEGATEAITNPSIYEKAGLIQADGLLPESFNNEKVLTLLAISLRHLNADQLGNLLKSITQRSKEATSKAGLISLEDVDNFVQWRNNTCYYSITLKGWCIFNVVSTTSLTTAQLYEIYQQQKDKP